MDIAGAKALKKRIGSRAADDAPRTAEGAEVPADAPPVYRWTGVDKAQSETPVGGEDETVVRASWLRRVAPSLR